MVVAVTPDPLEQLGRGRADRHARAVFTPRPYPDRRHDPFARDELSLHIAEALDRGDDIAVEQDRDATLRRVGEDIPVRLLKGYPVAVRQPWEPGIGRDRPHLLQGREHNLVARQRLLERLLIVGMHDERDVPKITLLQRGEHRGNDELDGQIDVKCAPGRQANHHRRQRLGGDFREKLPWRIPDEVSPNVRADETSRL